MTSISENLTQIQQQIKSLSETNSIRLIAVSKKFSTIEILKAYDCGQSAFGENYPQELHEKAEELINYPIEWHFIGNIQSNKIKYIAKHASWIHSLSKISHAKLLNEHRTKQETIKVLIEVNISGEVNKHGLNNFEEIYTLAMQIQELPNLELRGLMGMASDTQDSNVIKAQFDKLVQMKQMLNEHNIIISELSMGMSNDYQIAIKSGSTIVRIGSKIFGERKYA